MLYFLFLFFCACFTVFIVSRLWWSQTKKARVMSVHPCSNWSLALLSSQRFPIVSVLYSSLVNDYLLYIFLTFSSLQSRVFFNLRSSVLLLNFNPSPLHISSSPSISLWPETTIQNVCGATAGPLTLWTTATTLCQAPFTLGKNTVSSHLSNIFTSMHKLKVHAKVVLRAPAGARRACTSMPLLQKSCIFRAYCTKLL